MNSNQADTNHEIDFSDLAYESLVFAEQEAESDQCRYCSEDISISIHGIIVADSSAIEARIDE